MKFRITLDVTKLPKERIKTRSYTNKAGEEVTVKEITLDMVPLAEPRDIPSVSGLVESHWLVPTTTKEEYNAGVKFAGCGKATTFDMHGDNEPNPSPAPAPAPTPAGDDPFDEDIPF